MRMKGKIAVLHFGEADLQRHLQTAFASTHCVDKIPNVPECVDVDIHLINLMSFMDALQLFTTMSFLKVYC